MGKYDIIFCVRRARLLTQQTSITVYRLPTKKNKFPISASVCRKQTEVFCYYFRLQQTEDVVFRYFHFPYIYTEYRFPYIYPRSSVSIYIYTENGTNGKQQLVCCQRKTETENIMYNIPSNQETTSCDINFITPLLKK